MLIIFVFDYLRKSFKVYNKKDVLINFWTVGEKKLWEKQRWLRGWKPSLLFSGGPQLDSQHPHWGLTTIYNSSSRGPDTLPGFRQHQAHSWHTDKHVGKTLIHIKVLFKCEVWFFSHDSHPWLSQRIEQKHTVALKLVRSSDFCHITRRKHNSSLNISHCPKLERHLIEWLETARHGSRICEAEEGASQLKTSLGYIPNSGLAWIYTIRSRFQKKESGWKEI